MRAMRAEKFSGYEALKLVELPKPTITDGKVLVRITAAGVTPLDHTILFGNFHIPEVPLILGNEGAGVVEQGGGADFPAGSRVMFWGAYGAFEDSCERLFRGGPPLRNTCSCRIRSNKGVVDIGAVRGGTQSWLCSHCGRSMIDACVANLGALAGHAIAECRDRSV